MQQLMILRHADAGHWDPVGDDFSRRLSTTGTEHAQLLAKWIVANLPLPEKLICSTANRTRETIEPLLGIQTELADLTDYDPQIYNARLETLIAVLDFAFAEHNRILIVGHNPGVSHLASRVTSSSIGDPVAGLSTGTLLVAELEQGWEMGAAQASRHRVVTLRDVSVN